MFAKNGRYGPYVQWGDHDNPPPGMEKPKMSSLFQTMVLEKITMDEAEKLLSLPRHVGDDPADGTPIYANNGRYGPYVQKEKDYRNIDSEDRIFEITLDEALKIYSEPKVYKRGGGNMSAKGPLKEFGTDPVSEKNVTAKEGRFGVYVTDGETNASLGKGDRLEEISPERAFELLAIRREAIIAKGGTPGKKAKATKKKAAAKKKSRREEAPGEEEGRCQEALRPEAATSSRTRPPSRSPISTTDPPTARPRTTIGGAYRYSPAGSLTVRRVLASALTPGRPRRRARPDVGADAHSGKQSYLYVSVYRRRRRGPRRDARRRSRSCAGRRDPQRAPATRVRSSADLTAPVRAYVAEHMALAGDAGPWKHRLSPSLQVLPTENGLYIVLAFVVAEDFDEAPRSFTADFSVIIESDPEKDALLIIEDDWASATFDNGSEPLLGFSTGLTEQRVELGGASTIDSMVAIRGIGTDAVRVGIDLMLIVVAVVRAGAPGARHGSLRASWPRDRWHGGSASGSSR